MLFSFKFIFIEIQLIYNVVLVQVYSKVIQLYVCVCVYMYMCMSEKAMAPHSSTLAWKPHGRRSLVGCRLWGRTESDTTEAT